VFGLLVLEQRDLFLLQITGTNRGDSWMSFVGGSVLEDADILCRPFLKKGCILFLGLVIIMAGNFMIYV
jgi:hypothetical protein